MEDFKEFYEAICRVCFLQGEVKSMVSLTDSSSKDGLSCFGKAVTTFANIQLKNDCLPYKMCQKCLFRLKQAIIFKKSCEKSEASLRKLQLRFGGSELELKEKISQYVMFTQCFPNGWDQKPIKNRSDRRKDVSLSNKSNNLVENELNNATNLNNYDDYFSDLQEDSNSVETTENKNLEADILLEKMEKIIYEKPETVLHRKKYNQKKPVHRIGWRNQRLKQKLNQKEERNIQCSICNKILANVNTYKYHMQRHSSCRYVCEHCAKRYATYAELQYHLASTHDIGTFFICKECGFKAPRRFDLKEHERIHTGERPFTCDKCGLTFRRRFVWRKHALYHMEKTVQCPSCPKKFYLRSEMLAHANNVHERVYVYACNECDVTYARPATVRRHLIEKHGVAREMQGRITRINLGKSSIR